MRKYWWAVQSWDWYSKTWREPWQEPLYRTRREAEWRAEAIRLIPAGNRVRICRLHITVSAPKTKYYGPLPKHIFEIDGAAEAVE